VTSPPGEDGQPSACTVEAAAAAVNRPAVLKGVSGRPEVGPKMQPRRESVELARRGREFGCHSKSNLIFVCGDAAA
jgi:hypothetical protein